MPNFLEIQEQKGNVTSSRNSADSLTIVIAT